jgi:Fe-S-cluster containining protein
VTKIKKMSWMKELNNIYKDLDEEISALAPSCRACGECCHFDRYDYTLYTSDIEMDYVLKLAGPPKMHIDEEIDNGKCPYLSDNKCTIREHRPLGCRTFYCQEGWDTTSSDLYEKYLRRIKELCAENGREWNYEPMLSLLDKHYGRSAHVA